MCLLLLFIVILINKVIFFEIILYEKVYKHISKLKFPSVMIRGVLDCLKTHYSFESGVEAMAWWLKSKLCPCSGSRVLRKVNPIHKKGP